MVNKDSRIYIAGHNGMVGRAISSQLKSSGYDNIIERSSKELDLINQKQVEDFFASQPIDIVVVCAAKVGGIHANNTYPAEFIYNNLMIESNIIHNAWKYGVKRLLFLGSSCIYPKMAEQPIKEESLLSGPLEPTNEPYAIAKIAGIKLCESYNRQYGTDFRSVMPTNLYGPYDNFDLENSHVLPALIRKFHSSKKDNLDKVVLWGTGKPKRDFLHVFDLANAVVKILNVEAAVWAKEVPVHRNYVNIGSGQETSISQLAYLVSEIVGYNGRVVWDSTIPDGTPRKLLDNSLANSLGWISSVELSKGIKDTYQWCLDNKCLS
jgi:GDP-L-fucose synthase